MAQTRDLLPGYGCPTDAHYASTGVHGATEYSVREHDICVFEHDIAHEAHRLARTRWGCVFCLNHTGKQD